MGRTVYVTNQSGDYVCEMSCALTYDLYDRSVCNYWILIMSGGQSRNVFEIIAIKFVD